MERQPHAQPSRVNAEKGEVLVDGPNGLAFSLTPDAAQEIAQRLMTAANEARKQRDRQ